VDALDCREETHLVEHGDPSPLQQHIVLRDHLHSSNIYRSDDGGRVMDQHFVELPLVVSDGWGSVMTTGEYLPWVPVDELLVESLGLTKVYDTFQSYSRLQICLLALFDTFIIDSSAGGDRQGQGTWRVGRPRPPDRRVFIAYNNIGVDHQRQTVETLGVMVSILGHGIADISEGDTDSDSHGDEHGGLPTVISMTHEQLVGIGSDELPILPWDPGVHLVSRLFHLMMAQVAPESNILHSWMVLRGLAGACPMERDNFSLLILMIEYGDGWADVASTEVLLQMQLLDSRSSFHRYFSMRIQEWGIQYVYCEQTVMIRVVQRQHGDLGQRLAWDPGIAGLSISLTDGGEWILAGESHFDFPLSFSIEGSTSLEGDSLRSCSTSLWQQHVQLVETVLVLVWTWRIDSFRVEAMCHLQETHGVDMLHDYASQGIAVHVLIWDPGGRVRDSSALDGAYFVSHRWTWDPGIICGLTQLLLEDKQFSSREDCNVPTFGHHYITECYADQSSQMGVIASTGAIEGFYWAQLASLILFHHHDPFCTAWLWFRCIPTISVILSYFGLYVN
jgi:hypothetical protein